MANYIRFDWAMKRLLRNKANHAVLEGLMCSLLNEKFTIKRFLEAKPTSIQRTTSLIVWIFSLRARKAN